MNIRVTYVYLYDFGGWIWFLTYSGKFLAYSAACNLEAFHTSTGTGKGNTNSWTPLANTRVTKTISLELSQDRLMAPAGQIICWCFELDVQSILSITKEVAFSVSWQKKKCMCSITGLVVLKSSLELPGWNFCFSWTITTSHVFFTCCLYHAKNRNVPI